MSHLRLVPKPIPPVKRRSTQLSLFPELDREALRFVLMDTIGGKRFAEVMREYMPASIIDLRGCANFNIDHTLDRARAFALFKECESEYWDLGDVFHGRYRSASQNGVTWEDLGELVEGKILKGKSLGPIFILTLSQYLPLVRLVPMYFPRIPFETWDTGVFV